ARLKKLENAPMIYDYVDDNMPEYARATVKKLMDTGYLKGDENGKLGLDDNLLRMLVINDRAGVYDK
ncbi:MAG: N-acetylmuramoyl-L-alanine amidase, partial [Oscillospiraceae bacterium]